MKQIQLTRKVCLMRSAVWMRPLMIVLMAACVPVATAAQISSYTYYEMSQSDLISDGPPFVFDEGSDTDNSTLSGPGTATVTGQLTTFYQEHGVESSVGAWINDPGAPESVSMVAERRHDFTMRGNNETSLWQSTGVYVYGGTTFTDQVSFQAQHQGTKSLASVEYFWRLAGLYTHNINIPTNPQERPLYRLHDRLRFTVEAGGAEVQPIDIEANIYDPHATGLPNPPFWSVLQEDVSDIEEFIPGIEGDMTFTVMLDEDTANGGAPVEVSASLFIETWNRFLNDGPELNYFLEGHTRLNFAQSADLIGIIVRDETGAIRTDVDVTSALGVNYLLLPEPSTLVFFAGAVCVLPVWRRRHG